MKHDPYSWDNRICVILLICLFAFSLPIATDSFTLKDIVSVASQSSPVADVDFWTSPVLFVHGDDNWNVDFIQTTDLVLRLQKLNKAKVELLIFPDEVHGFLRHEN